VNYFQKIIWLFALAAVLFSGIYAAEELIHVVGRGETIFSISRFYRVSADELMAVNNITDPARLQAGRRLIIPSSAFSDISVSAVPATRPLADYRVVRGDTLFNIARTNGITLQQLMEMNNFPQNHVIRVGDVVKIPGGSQGTSVATPSSASAARTPGGTAAASTASGTPNILSLRWPINPREISYMTGQMGVVIEGEYFEPVRSLTQGRVISAGPWRKFGKVVIVEAAGGYFYMYGGCESLSVKVGDRIAPGTEVGKLGINTVSERPQLFFMVFRSDTPIDPAKAPRAGSNGRT
jgi:murein DD-endopeptidase MepM/ murein hydrolase activator NlpD